MWLRVATNAPCERRLQTIFPIVGRVRTDGDRNGLRYFYPWPQWHRRRRRRVPDERVRKPGLDAGDVRVRPGLGAAVSLYPRDRTGVVKGLVLKKQSPEPGPMVRHCEVILQEEVPSVEPLDFEQGLGMAVYALPKTVPVGADIRAAGALRCGPSRGGSGSGRRVGYLVVALAGRLFSCCSLPRSGYIPQPRVAAPRGGTLGYHADFARYAKGVSQTEMYRAAILIRRR